MNQAYMKDQLYVVVEIWKLDRI